MKHGNSTEEWLAEINAMDGCNQFTAWSLEAVLKPEPVGLGEIVTCHGLLGKNFF